MIISKLSVNPSPIMNCCEGGGRLVSRLQTGSMKTHVWGDSARKKEKE
jgi:hypothetical protein